VVAVLLLPALTLTSARLVEPQASFWLLAEAFTPLAIVPYAAGALLLGVRLVLVRRWWTWLACGIALGGLVLHLAWFAPQVTGANPPPAEGAQRLVVMTANLAQEDGDAIALVRVAAQAHVALLVVEEIGAGALAEMDRAGLADLLPYRAGRPLDDGHGTMVFSRAELGPAERIDTWHDGWVVPMGDLVVVAAHPQAPTQPDLWRADHAALLRTVRERQPDLVLGDLNATADHAPMRRLADAGLRDVGELLDDGWQPTWPSSGRWSVLGVAAPPLAQIDHVLVGPRLAAVGMRTVAIPGSDHRAVIAEVARML